ncbi:alkyl hydroperoxide reductase subunit F [Desertimonas flava]|uniref:alkyl hydroperoxide reductase subunit F n=1 Tax=Desertimonas flava TaxID=2064846 RepID=UPI000E352F93|nr:alkyl hydroperoxide reductase subunit F [Desertimonas flava]
MLDATLAAQLKTYLDNITKPIELIASLDDAVAPTGKSAELIELLDEIAAMSPNITVRRDGDDGRRPSFAIMRADAPSDVSPSDVSPSDVSVRFAGIPLGHEFTSLVLALLQVGGHPSKAAAETIEQVQALEGDLHFETYFSLSCQNCPDVVQALNLMSVLNPNVHHVAIDGALFPDEVEARQVLAVPTVFLNGEPFDSGRMSLEQIVAKLDTGAAAKEAARLDAKESFDVLVVGGGPAGAAAAVYAARKGIRTGVAAERLGGQVLDTMSIENLISVPHTDGPKLAAALEQHVREYDVDVMNLQRATRLVPAAEPGGLISVELENGATLHSRTVILSTGARWRQMNVPGEAEYRNKGVTYCPHCDGPLFKGKRVAVIGGGNSGVEAAIDLAGVVSHVTLIEFDARLRADDVLLRKLHSLPNVDVIVSALTTEVIGDGSVVTGLRYDDRTTGAAQQLDVDGIFVQIGLLPNTEWLSGTVDLSPRGEIVIDDRGQTSVPGVFAAGDCTTVPYKQIVIALGAGSTAALSAFDHLIRTPLPVDDPQAEPALA